MKTKEYIIKDYKKHKRHKKVFLLAWHKYLTYDELVRVDMVDAYEAYRMGGVVRSRSEWDDNVKEYTEENIKKSLCIEFNKCVSAIPQGVKSITSVCADDIAGWLSILGDNDIKYKSTLDIDTIKCFLKEVADKYHFEFKG